MYQPWHHRQSTVATCMSAYIYIVPPKEKFVSFLLPPSLLMCAPGVWPANTSESLHLETKFDRLIRSYKWI